MFNDIRKRFLDDAVDGVLHLWGEPGLAARLVTEFDLEIDGEAADRPQPFGERLKCGLESVVIEHRRTQIGDQVAQRANGDVDPIGCVSELRFSLGRISRDPYRGEQQFQRRELLQRLVVELACPAGAFLFGSREAALQSLRRHVLGGSDRGGGAGCKRAQQPFVSLAELRSLAQAVECSQHTKGLAAEAKRNE